MASRIIDTIKIGELTIDVIAKDIKNIHLSVYPPNGQVSISAPKNINTEALRAYAISKLGWIKQQQRKFQDQIRYPKHTYDNRESHFVWGQRYLLQTIEKSSPPQVTLHPNHLLLQVRPGTSSQKKQQILETFYRNSLRTMLPPLIEKWEKRMQVTVEKITIRKMKTKWGSCSPHIKSIRLNLELAKKPPECLEYVLVHEMTHLLEASHNKQFIHQLNQFLPQWKSYQQTLNQIPMKSETWQYNFDSRL